MNSLGMYPDCARPAPYGAPWGWRHGYCEANFGCTGDTNPQQRGFTRRWRNFEVVSPVRPGGRPNQKASAKKTKKKRGVIDACHDSNMHHMQLDLSLLSKMLLEDHTPNSSEKTLRQYRLKKVTTLQSRHKGLKEVDIVLEVPNIGIFSAETLRTMRNYHRAIDAIAAIDRTIGWVATIDFSIDIDP
ncbi:hypothetical protein JG687_00016093 [Phytophthora cactorum]|uniref:Uncharacterized protein n=1 Tax=Phytophthora cactorum TaxID=29920 RepID=A0A8T1TU71_9STRA|nr:hypothetical protein JG687_00016093 [Phytophthora cactorum]